MARPYGAPSGVKPNNYLAWAIISTIVCCLPFGVVSIVFASKVDSLWFAGDTIGAQDASNKAKTWAIVSAVTALVPLLAYVVFFVVLAASGS